MKKLILLFMCLSMVLSSEDPCEEYWGPPGYRKCARCRDGLLQAYSKAGIYCAELREDGKTCEIVDYDKRWKFPPNHPFEPTYVYSGPKKNLTDTGELVDVQFCYSQNFYSFGGAVAQDDFGYPEVYEYKDRIVGYNYCNHTVAFPQIRLDEKLRFHFLDCVKKTEVEPPKIERSRQAYLESQKNPWQTQYVEYEGEGCYEIGKVKKMTRESPLHEYKLECQHVGDWMPGCLAGNLTRCELCQDNQWPATITDRDGVNKTACYNNFFGLFGNQLRNNSDCDIKNCAACSYVDEADSATCSRCEPGYYLTEEHPVDRSGNVDITTLQPACKLQEGSKHLDLFVFSFEGIFMESDELNQAQGEDQSLGENTEDPYRFISQMLNHVHSGKGLEAYSEVEVSVWLGKGSHYFFWCSDGATTESAEIDSQYSGQYTDFCNQIPLLKHRYPMSDKISFNFRPLECELRQTKFRYISDFGKVETFDKHCLNLDIEQKPEIRVQGPYFYFNVTNHAQFENIRFTGEDMYFQGYSDKQERLDLSVYPIQKCEVLEKPPSKLEQYKLKHRGVFPFAQSQTCEDPYSYEDVPMSSTINCAGPEEPLGSCTSGDFTDPDFFEMDANEFYFKRRKALFNLYSFDTLRTTSKTSPELNLINCEFEYFTSEQEALIVVETNNYSKFNSDAMGLYGQDRGANIQILDSTFQNMRTCNGLIVYKQTVGEDLGNDHLLFNFTAQRNQTVEKDEHGKEIEENIPVPRIQIMNSDFINIGLTQPLKYLDWLEDDIGFDSAWALWGVKKQRNKGLILNLDGAQSAVSISDTTFRRNMVYIPDILITNRTLAQSQYYLESVDHLPGSEYFDIETSRLMFKYCDQLTKNWNYFFSTAFNPQKDFDDESLYFSYSQVSPIMIQRQSQPVFIQNNTFESNIGTTGGVITLAHQVYRQDLVGHDYDDKRPYLIIENNEFKANMAYFAGNAVYVANSMYYSKQEHRQQVCGAGILIRGNTFTNHIGTKKHNGGAVAIRCQHDTTEKYSNAGLKVGEIYSDSYLDKEKTIVGYQKPDNETYDLKNPYVSGARNSTILRFGTLIKQNLFADNSSGQKGTAVLTSKVNEVQIIDNQFQNNGPVFALKEAEWSPYYFFLAKEQRFLTFYDDSEKCQDEFEWVTKCAKEGLAVDFPSTQGAIYSEQCVDSEECVLTLDDLQKYKDMNQTERDSYMAWYKNVSYPFPYYKTTISRNYFYNNQANMVLASDQSELQAASIYVKALFDVDIHKNEFRDHKSDFGPYILTYARDLYTYMPSGYFESSQAPIARLYQSDILDSFSESKLNLTENTFDENYFYQVLTYKDHRFKGGLLEMIGKSHSRVIMTDNKVINNKFVGPSSSLFHLENTNSQIKNNIFSSNGYASLEILKNTTESQKRKYSDADFSFDDYEIEHVQDGGAIALSATSVTNSQHEFTNNTFEYLFCKQGCVTQVSGNQKLTLLYENNNITNLVGKTKGSLLSSDLTGGNLFLHLLNETIDSVYGGAISVKGAGNAFVENSRFKNAYGQTGAAFQSQQSSAYILNCTFEGQQIKGRRLTEGNKLKSGYKGRRPFSFLASDEMIESIEQLDNQMGQVSLVDANDNEIDPQIQSMIENKMNMSLGYGSIILDSEFKNLTGQDASAINLQRSKLCITGRKTSLDHFKDNTARAGSTIAALDSELELIQIQMLNNKAVNGGCLNLEGSNTNITNSTFLENSADTGGVIYAQNNNRLTLSNSIVTRSYARDSAFLYSVDNQDPQSTESSLRLNNTKFTENEADMNLMYVLLTDMSIENTEFVDNLASDVNNGITMIESNLTAQNILVDLSPSDGKIQKGRGLRKNQNRVADTGFFILFASSYLHLGGNSTIQNQKAKNSAVLNAQQQSAVKITGNVKFLNNTAAAVYDASTLSFQSMRDVLIDGAYFANNTQTNIKAHSARMVTIKNSNFTRGGGSLIQGFDSSVDIQHVKLYDSGFEKAEGHGVKCQFCKALTIKDSEFRNLTGLLGGALYVTNQTGETALITNATFKNNIALWRGGAIFLHTPETLNITGNLFENNQARNPEDVNNVTSKVAGGIYYACDPQIGIKCNVTLNSNKFIGNKATNKGGAIMWANRNFITDEDIGNEFVDNQAVYGPNVANYPRSLWVFSWVSEIYVKDAEEGQLQTSEAIQTEYRGNGQAVRIAPGQPIQFSINVTDKDYQTMTDENSATCRLDFKDIEVYQVNGLERQRIIGAEIPIVKGAFFFGNLIFKMKPNSTAAMTIRISEMEDYGNSVFFLKSLLQLNVFARECIEGERMTPDYECVSCATGSYLYEKVTDYRQCIPCEAEAFCYGRNVTAPRPGYWRSNSTRSDYTPCFRKESCLGGSLTEPLGVCEENYQGVVCADCLGGYYKTVFNQCHSCGGTVWRIILVALYTQALIGSIVFICWRTKVYAEKCNFLKYPQGTVYIKILIHHCQLLTIVAALDYSTPSVLENAYQFLYSMASILEPPVGSFECLYDTFLGWSTIRFSIVKTVVSATLPLVMMIPIGLSVQIIGVFHSWQRYQTTDTTICAIVVFIYMHWPFVLTQMFEFMNCTYIEGELRLMSDPELTCFSRTHVLVLIVFVIPALILNTLIPYLFYKMSKKITEEMHDYRYEQTIERAKMIKIKQIKRRFGFMIEGFKPGHEYWEVMNMIQKYIVVIVYVFLGKISAGIQCCLILFLTEIGIRFLFNIKPYKSEKLNYMQKLSQFAMMLNIYFGLYFLSGLNNDILQESTPVEWIFAIMAVLSNMVWIALYVKDVYTKILVYYAVKNQTVFKYMTFGLVQQSVFKNKHLRGKNADGDTCSDEEEFPTYESQQKSLNQESQDETPNLTSLPSQSLRADEAKESDNLHQASEPSEPENTYLSGLDVGDQSAFDPELEDKSKEALKAHLMFASQESGSSEDQQGENNVNSMGLENTFGYKHQNSRGAFNPMLGFNRQMRTESDEISQEQYQSAESLPAEDDESFPVSRRDRKLKVVDEYQTSEISREDIQLREKKGLKSTKQSDNQNTIWKKGLFSKTDGNPSSKQEQHRKRRKKNRTALHEDYGHDLDFE